MMQDKKSLMIGGVVILILLAGGYYGWSNYKTMQATPEVQAAKLNEQKNTIISLTGSI